MKALILAAGFGTRLKPYTDLLPKPLFPLGEDSLLDLIISSLCEAGCLGIRVNTHHLGDRIRRHIKTHRYPIPVETCHEPDILGTGGAIGNAGGFLDDRPFMVINSDIVTDIDLAAVYRYHLTHTHPATLVLLNHPAFNSVAVDRDDYVVGFDKITSSESNRSHPALTFSGIQVLDPGCLRFFPRGVFSSSIDAYRKMMASGLKIKAWKTDRHRWRDIGTPERYKKAVMEVMIPKAFEKAFPGSGDSTIKRARLKGDGSDRKWYRVSAGRPSLILVDHGIRATDAVCEAEAFIHIGRHLFQAGTPVPEIVLADAFSGVVLLEDVGDVHLQDLVTTSGSNREVTAVYRRVIDEMIHMSHFGLIGFNPDWTWQTPRYDREVVLENECRYFVESFLNGYLDIGVRFEEMADDFHRIAEGAVSCSLDGFMHRDFQSRNIMVTDNRIYFIDFQGGRVGPLQYDLASLLIDPYVDLPKAVRRSLVDYCIGRLPLTTGEDKNRFWEGFRWCALSRNLQILGAFGYLSREKGKTAFEKYIPIALKMLKERISGFQPSELVSLGKMVSQL